MIEKCFFYEVAIIKNRIIETLLDVLISLNKELLGLFGTFVFLKVHCVLTSSLISPVMRVKDIHRVYGNF